MQFKVFFYFFSVVLIFLYIYILDVRLTLSYNDIKVLQPINSSTNEAPVKETQDEVYIKVGTNTYSLQKALELFLSRNKQVQKILYNILERDTALKKFDSKYKIKLNTSAGYNYREEPTTSDFVKDFLGDTFSSWEVLLGASKTFITGTTISLDYRHTFSVDNAEPIGVSTEDYTNAQVLVKLEQELLKNFLGINDHKIRKVYKKRASMVVSTLLDQLASSFISTLDLFWKINIATEIVKNLEEELEATYKLYNIIKKNSNLGLVEKFSIYQYRSLISSVEIRLHQAKVEKRNYIRDFKYLLSISEPIEIQGITRLLSEKPSINNEKSLIDAFIYRSDYKNALTELEIAQLELSVAKHELLPSLKLSLGGVLNSQGTNFSNTYKDIFPNFSYPEFDVAIHLSYPLNDTLRKTNIRNSFFNLNRAKLEIEDLTIKINKEVLDSIDNLDLAYNIMLKNREISRSFKKYYRGFIKRVKQGKFSYLQVKDTIKSLNDIREQELRSQVLFNIAVLNYELQKGTLLQYCNVDFNKLYTILLSDFLKNKK